MIAFLLKKVSADTPCDYQITEFNELYSMCAALMGVNNTEDISEFKIKNNFILSVVFNDSTDPNLLNVHNACNNIKRRLGELEISEHSCDAFCYQI